MANQTLFSTRLTPRATALDSEGAPAYAFEAKHALAQYAATGCLHSTFYASADLQLDQVLRLAGQVPPRFLAQAALYARQRGAMKDLPALLCAMLSVVAPDLCEAVFDRVIDSGKMLRNFVQIIRSGAVGRRSLASHPRRLVRRWLAAADDRALLRASIGQSPSLADVLKLAHPRPGSPARAALYGYLLGRAHDPSALPAEIQMFEAYKKDRRMELPDVPFQMLTALDLGAAEWIAIAKRATWQETRMNLNTFARHGVFQNRQAVTAVATRLADRGAVKRSRALPYQLLMAYQAAGQSVPPAIRRSLHDALDHALTNVPTIDGTIYVCPDVSGSMQSPVTGYRPGATTAVRCIDVAALVAAAFLRVNDAEVLPFEQHVVRMRLDPRDSVMTNAGKLASIGGGGTSCSAPLAELNRKHARGQMVILVSDNESWVDAGGGCGTALLREWELFRSRNRAAVLVCIDLQPNRTTQALDRPDILNVGGFSDAVFELVAAFGKAGADRQHWVDAIERTVI
jgi:60 kDa SS-A/Ro ribonucleoprotein